jgi:hypothetical protein
MTHDELKLKILNHNTVLGLTTILLAVVDLHSPDDHTAVQCQGCSSYWPCKTIKTIQEELL